MRGFIVLCFSALAVAAPQGYNYPLSSNQQSGYGQQQQLSVNNQYLAPIGGNHHQESHLNHQQFRPQMVLVPQPQQGLGLQSQSFGSVQQPIAPKPEVRVSKRFFIHSAPEEEEEDYKEKHLTVGTPSKNYNVVFIKAPAKSSKKQSIKITPAVNEEKTVIYVLSKKTDASDIDAQIQELPTTTTKPEVYFIKYKTPEEAAHAQEKIQAEYDNLGGTSQVTNEGIAPVTSVIGAIEEKLKQEQQQEEQHQLEQQLASITPVGSNTLQENNFSSGQGASVSISNSVNTNNGYLPPNYYY
ncbi:uncharacterized protein LOC129915074 [Episyrphus balteatus]|uniref:uncharacterized protein LOC129915074 n=1 Tax=Episyrphus balteatus TaxID=286459 RepID=UPI002485C190|nr:uncharacterized protein LOC129915074 [Episyrphus balteatus]